MNPSRSMLAVAALSMLTFAPLAHGEGWPWARQLETYESHMKETASREGRFEALDHAAVAALMLGKIETARSYAEESLGMAESYSHNWNYGNAIHDGHAVLGLLALQKDDVTRGEVELLAAGRTPGSGTISKYGPNMSLAKALLEKGRRTAVLAYLEECRLFWDDHGRLDEWELAVEQGEIPDFKGRLWR